VRAVALRKRGDPAKRAKAEKALGREPGGFGTCARCWSFTYVNGHERIGGSGRRDATKPDCLLCLLCNGWAEDFPILAAAEGWKVSPKNPRSHDLGPFEARRVDGSIHHFPESSEL
jgi:hypothetical protein